jgi:hypothetical protein
MAHAVHSCRSIALAAITIRLIREIPMVCFKFDDFDAWCGDAIARGYLGPRQRQGNRRYEFLDSAGQAAATWTDDAGIVWGDPPQPSQSA